MLKTLVMLIMSLISLFFGSNLQTPTNQDISDIINITSVLSTFFENIFLLTSHQWESKNILTSLLWEAQTKEKY